MNRVEQQVTPEIVVEVDDGFGSDLADYARRKVAAALRNTRRPITRVHVRVLRHGDPAREKPVTAHVNVDLDGRPVQARAASETARGVVDLLVQRLRHQLERFDRHRDHRRAGPPAAHEPAAEVEPEIVRHATSSPVPCSVDEAVAEMDDMGLDFHLFVETATGKDALVYRDGPTGLRLTRSDGGAIPPVSSNLAITVSPQPAPLLDTGEAIERLGLTGLPFLFYLDGEHQRATVLYHRDDGNYGLVDPARNPQ
jgi:ribosome-associated translation inhibitor RaiA